MRRDSCASSLKHLGKKKKTDSAANFHTHYPFLPQEHKVSPCVRTFDLAVLVLCISPEAENHYKHFVSRYTCHATASSDSRQSKVLVMPPVPALICMRAGTGLWCNCSSGEGQCLCPNVHNIKAWIHTQHLAFFMVIVMLSEGGRMTLLIRGAQIDEILLLIVPPPNFFMLLGVRLSRSNVALSSPLLDTHHSNLLIRGVELPPTYPGGLIRKGSPGSQYNGPFLLFMLQL